MSSQPSPRPRVERYLAGGSKTAAWHARAREQVPGATSRLHYVFEPYPIVAHAGRGCWLTDIDGDERIDCLNNMTALIHGHCDPDVTAAITAQLQRGVSFSEPAEPELALASLLIERVPSIERIHFRSSGTEAVMMGIKLARAFTGRDRIAKFEGGYHGYYDYVQMSVLSSPANWGEAQAPRNVPSSRGLAGSVDQEVLTLPFNDPDGVERLLRAHGAGIAVLLVEPLSNRSGMARPAPGFFEFLRDITRRHGILLLFDEVIALRVGMQGAQGRYGASPDLTAFGKIIGGGLPIGAIGGRADVLDQLDPAGTASRVISGGTYSGNPLSAVAGLATLQKLTPAEFERLDALGERLRSGLNRIFQAAGLSAQASGDASLFQIVPTDRPITDYRSIPRDAAAVAWLDRLHRELLANGVIISNRGLACLSTAMDEAVVDETLSAFEAAVAGAAQ